MVTVVATAIQCGLAAHAVLLDAIVRVESAGNPHALAVNGDVELIRQPASRDEAVAMARWLLEHGYNFDAGLGQVNSANFSRLGLDVVSVFEPCANLRAASRVLDECYDRAYARIGRQAGALTAALSCYNTGHFTRGVTNGYVDAVRASAAGPLLLRTRDATAPTIATADAGAGPQAIEKEAVGRPVAMNAGRVGRAARRGDAFAQHTADAFGTTRSNGWEGAR